MTDTLAHRQDTPAALPPPPPRYQPVEVAPDTFVIQATVGEGVAPLAVHLNSMVIRGAQPVVVDTGAPINRDQYLEDLFSLVEPEDVRWVVISHDDADHFGNAEAVMAACPNATLVATWFLCERLSTEAFAVPPTRWRWVGDGESLDAGDRTLQLVRPPLYDSPTTRGVFDPTTGVYWAVDCYATPVVSGTEFVDELDPGFWAEGFASFQWWNSPWLDLVDRDRWAAENRRMEELGIRTIASAHGPTIGSSQVERAFELMRRLQDTPAPPQPGQPVLEEIIASFDA